MKTNRSLTLRVLAALLLCVLLFPFVTACTTPSDDGESTPTDGAPTDNAPDNSAGGRSNYTVSVKTLGGMPLEGIMCYVHKGDGYNIVARQETDENGVAVFELEQATDYSVELDGVKEGYDLQERYAMNTTGVAITLSSAPIKDKSLKGKTFELGDVIYDFTVTDVDGNSHTISSLLEEKKMVMLNFWYSTCTWCNKEFPYMNSAYGKYSDSIEILAINDYSLDSVSTVENFVVFDAEGNPVELSFPLVKVNDAEFDSAPTLDKFIENEDDLGYPTSVFIDRYGVISLIEIGGVPNERLFTNTFDHFTAENYEQRLIESMSTLAPAEKPNISMPSSEEISAAFDKGAIEVTYSPETNPNDAEYSWPFIVDEKDGEPCIRPSNEGRDNSYATIYATVHLEKDEALVFDYFSSTESMNDILYVLIDGKDIYSISGVEEEGWQTCCAYVAREAGTYELSLCYLKDEADAIGDDTVYLRSLRTINKDEIDIPSYIYRFASTHQNETGTGYESYVEVFYNEADGYYHVDSVDGPILLANILGYTCFDGNKTVSERLYEAGEFIIDGEDRFQSFIQYGNYASNSKAYSYCSVTKELREYLEEYVNTYRQVAGKEADENLWLQLCVYYDAYGTDGAQLEDPIRGLASFSAYEATLGTNTVKYERVVMPRGYLYRFVPTVSGVYRITSASTQEVDGWIFVGNSGLWAENENGDRNLYASSEICERICTELLIDDGNGGLTRDLNNISMVAYMEAGTEYYIDIAFYDPYATGEFTFEIKHLGETFNAFVEASPGPFTFILDPSGQFGSTVAGGIEVEICTDVNDERYGYYCQKLEDGSLGYIVYADFYMPTNIFPDQSIQELIRVNAFNFKISESDRDALAYWNIIKSHGKTALRELWGDEFDSRWESYAMDDAWDGYYNAATESQAKTAVEFMEEQGIAALKEELGEEFDSIWELCKMDEVRNGVFHGDGVDYTAIMREYEKLMLDEPDAPERQGCVPVNAELAEILQMAVDAYVFENVEDSWRKFCFFYDMLGTNG